MRNQLIIASLLLLSACSKKNDNKTTNNNNNNNNTPGFTFSAKLDGEALTAIDWPGSYYHRYTDSFSSELEIVGHVKHENITTGIHIDIDPYDGPGTYTGAHMAVVYTNQNEKNRSSYSGTITITKDDGDKVQGTFSGTVYENPNIESGDSIVVTEGKFDVPDFDTP